MSYNKNNLMTRIYFTKILTSSHAYIQLSRQSSTNAKQQEIQKLLFETILMVV